MIFFDDAEVEEVRRQSKSLLETLPRVNKVACVVFQLDRAFETVTGELNIFQKISLFYCKLTNLFLAHINCEFPHCSLVLRHLSKYFPLPILIPPEAAFEQVSLFQSHPFSPLQYLKVSS
jgi:hypothetical protein